MRGHKIYFYGEIWKIIPKLSLLPNLIWNSANRCLFLSKHNFKNIDLPCKTHLEYWNNFGESNPRPGCSKLKMLLQCS